MDGQKEQVAYDPLRYEKKFSSSLPLHQVQRSGVHAVPHVGRCRSIIENVAEMCITPATENLDPEHPETSVFVRFYILFCYWCREARPAGPGFELVF